MESIQDSPQYYILLINSHLNKIILYYKYKVLQQVLIDFKNKKIFTSCLLILILCNYFQFNSIMQ